MDVPSKLLEQGAFNTRPKIKEHIIVVMDKTTHERHLSQPLKTNIRQFKVAINFLTDYDSIFKDTNSNNKISFAKSFTDNDGFNQTTIPTSADEIERLNEETDGIIFDEEHLQTKQFQSCTKSLSRQNFHGYDPT